MQQTMNMGWQIPCEKTTWQWPPSKSQSQNWSMTTVCWWWLGSKLYTRQKASDGGQQLHEGCLTTPGWLDLSKEEDCQSHSYDSHLQQGEKGEMHILFEPADQDLFRRDCGTAILLLALHVLLLLLLWILLLVIMCDATLLDWGDGNE